MSNLKPLTEIQNVRDILFDKYLDIIDAPNRLEEELDVAFEKEFDLVRKWRVELMPYYMVVELDRLGYDVGLKFCDVINKKL